MINQLTFFFYHYDYYIVITVRMIVKIDFYFFQCRTLIPKMQFVKFLKILHIIVIEIIFVEISVRKWSYFCNIVALDTNYVIMQLIG